MFIKRHDQISSILIKTLYRRAYRATDWPSTVESVDEPTVRQWMGNRTIFVGIDDGLVGAVQTKDSWIKRLAVKPERRGNGYGRGFLSHAEQVVGREHDRAVLRANDEIDWLVAWYRRRGYRIVEHQDLPDYPFNTVKMVKEFG